MRHLRLCDPRNLLISSALNRRVTFCDVVINVDLHYSFSGVFFFFEFLFIVLSLRPSDMLQEIRYMCGGVFIVDYQ